LQVGIKRVVVDKASVTDADFQARWDEKGKFSERMFKEAGVAMEYAEALSEDAIRSEG
jgi:hypothetical protein